MKRLILAFGALLVVAALVWSPAPALARQPAPVLVRQAAPALARQPAPLGYRLPLDGPVTRPFEPPLERWLPGHRGVDLGGSPGATVHAAGRGVVAFVGMVAGRPVLAVDHLGGLRTTYEPVVGSVPVGWALEAGTPIGVLREGHAGCPVAACLHWGLRRGETYLDPLSLLRTGRVTLLPLAG